MDLATECLTGNVFSMPLPTTIARDLLRHTLPELEPRAKALPLDLVEINEVLPEGGLPRGGVVEIASPRGLARATSIALSACAAAQAEARLKGGEDTEGAWCAWIDPSASLFAPAVAAAGVDLGRLLVVRPPLEALARVAVRMALSRAFLVLVVDTVGVPGAKGATSKQAGRGARGQRAEEGEDLGRWINVVRKLSVAVEGSDATVLLMTDRLAARPMPLPVAMRLEVDRLDEGRLSVRVAKDRRGRVTQPAAVPLQAAGGKSRDPIASAAWPRSA